MIRPVLSPPASSLAAPSAVEIMRVALITGVGFGLYGLTVGWWRSPLMGGYVAVKMPLVMHVCPAIGITGYMAVTRRPHR